MQRVQSYVQFVALSNMQIHAPYSHASEVCNSEKMSYHEILKQTNRSYGRALLLSKAESAHQRCLLILYFDMNDFDKYIQIWPQDQNGNSTGLYKGRILVTLRHILGSSALHLIKIVSFHDLSTLINTRRIVQAGL